MKIYFRFHIISNMQLALSSCQSIFKNLLNEKCMGTRIWIFLINTFLVNTYRNFKKTLSLINDHLSKLESQSADPAIAAIILTCQPLVDSVNNLYAQWQQTL